MGGADEVEPSAEDRVSDSPQPEEEVEVLESGAPTIKEEGPLSTVQEDEVLEDAQASPSPSRGRSSKPAQEARSAQEVIDLTQDDPADGAAEVNAGTSATMLTEAQVKSYVADQVRRWERDESERSVPPTIKTDWQQDRLDSGPYVAAALRTSEYVGRRMSMESQADAWISEMQLKRVTFGVAQDLNGILVPPAMFSPQECAAVLQTLFFEAGFEFVNLVPGWFRTRANKVHPDLVRRVVGDLIQLLAIELIEWKQLISAAEEAQGQTGVPDDADSRPPRLEYHAEDRDGDLLMNDYEANLLGREHVLQLKVAGLRKVRSPRGSTYAEPRPKRPQHQPPRPEVSPSPSLESPLSISPEVSLRNAGLRSAASRSTASERSGSVQTSSLFGTGGGSDQSLASASSGTFASRDSSSLSSGWSVGHAAGGHMPMAMMAQGLGEGAPSGGPMAMHIKRKVLPPAPLPVDQDDVVMSESGSADVRSRRHKSSGKHSRRRDARSSSSSESSESEDDHRHNRRSRSRHSRRSGRRSPSSRSSRSGRSRRSGNSLGSASSGATQVALNTMRQVQDEVSRLERNQGSTLEKLGQSLKMELGRMVQDQLADAQPMEDIVPSPPEASQVRHEAETLEALRAEAARLERERSEALLGHYQAHVEARQAEETERTAAMMAAVQQDLRDMRLDRDQERETAKNLQRFFVEQLRNLRATSAQVQGSMDNVKADPATQGQKRSDRATLDGQSSEKSGGVINDRVSTGHLGQGKKNADEVFAAQLQDTLNAAKAVTFAKANAAAVPKASAAALKSEPLPEAKAPVPPKPPVSRTSPVKPSPGTSKSREPRKQGSSRKKKPGDSRRHGDPSDSDPSSDSSDSSGSDSSSDSSAFGDTTPSVTMKSGDGGSTVYTFKPFVNSNTLEDFNEKASLASRIRWLERFQSMATQGGWTDQTKIYEMKLKMSAPVRNWRANLEPKERRDWRRVLKAFREMYCKAKTSDSERYYTMIQKKSETPLEFYYRLNKVAEKAGIDFKSSTKMRERHLKTFTKKLLDSRLRTTLQGQRMRKIKDLEFILKQHDEMAQEDDYETPPPKRDFRADNVPQGRFRPKRSGRAYVIQSEDESESDDDRHVQFRDAVDEVSAKKKTIEAES